MEQSFAVRGQTHHKEACAAALDTDVVTLVPDPENKFHNKSETDGYPAVKVMAGEKHIGFVPKETCSWFGQHEVGNLRLHRSKRSGMLIVYFTADEIAPKQGSVGEPTTTFTERAVDALVEASRVPPEENL
jgi:hypothetical protein